MTPADIIAKLWPPADKDRIRKAQGLASRTKVDWQLVLDAMSDDQRKQVSDVSS